MVRPSNPSDCLKIFQIDFFSTEKTNNVTLPGYLKYIDFQKKNRLSNSTTHYLFTSKPGITVAEKYPNCTLHLENIYKMGLQLVWIKSFLFWCSTNFVTTILQRTFLFSFPKIDLAKDLHTKLQYIHLNIARDTVFFGADKKTANTLHLFREFQNKYLLASKA